MFHDSFFRRYRWVLPILFVAGVIATTWRLTPRVIADPAPADNYHRPAPATVNLGTSPGDHRMKFKTKIGDHAVEMAYLLHFPPDYGKPGVKSPMLVFLHGIGECGNDLAGIYNLGPMTLLKANGGNEAFAASCPYIVLCPQCPPRGQVWNDDFMYRAVVELVEQTIKNSKCDPDRVYVTGLSMGGLGTWCVAQEDPTAFAAAAPLSAMKWNPETAADKLKRVSVWGVAGQNDDGRFVDGTHAMETALKGTEAGSRFTYVVNASHEIFVPCYESPQFYEWFLSHRRLPEGKKYEPVTDTIPTASGHYQLTFNTKIGDQQYGLDYVLYVPKPIKGAAPGTPHPAMLYLHEQDVMGPVYKDICVHGPDLVLEKTPGLQNNFPFVVISPRLPIRMDWDSPGLKESLLALVDHVNESLPLDPDRIIVTGMNNGANAAWKLADGTDKFAAVAVTMTDGSFNFPGDPAAVMKKMPGRMYVKSSNKPAIERMMQLKSQTKLDWKLINAVPVTAGPITDTPMYGDHGFLTWATTVKRGK